MKRIKADKIGKKLGAEQRGKVTATGGYFGAAQLASDIAARFQVPVGGGRSTDPSWDKKRLIPLASDTLASLEKLAKEISTELKMKVEPMQLAAIVLEKFLESIKESERKALIDEALQTLDAESSNLHRKKNLKTTRVRLHLRVENNNKFVRGRKRSIRDIERICLSQYAMKKLKGYGDYELVISYKDEKDLEDTIYHIFSECESWASMRNCFTEADIWEIGSDRQW